MKSDDVKAGLMLAAVGAAAYVGWKTYKGGTGVMKAAAQAVEQAAANVQSAWVNNVSTPFQRGQDYMNGVEPVVSSKAWLYSDYQYTGKDPATGQLITDGEWYGNADARRYDAAQRINGTPPVDTSINGAAFGVYPSVFNSTRINAAAASDARQIDRIIERQQAQALGTGGATGSR